jgi:hypothetical protein
MLRDNGFIRARCFYGCSTVERTHGLCAIGYYRRPSIPQNSGDLLDVSVGSTASIRAAVPATFDVAPDVP